MRLWHYKLIPVLPNQMLISQWRECIAIKRQWEKGTLKHGLVAYVKENHKGYFYRYVWDIMEEMKNRNIKFQEKYLNEISIFTNGCGLPNINQHYPEHNSRYLRQCYYNLQEKFDRGIIDEWDWAIIFDNWNEVVKNDE